MTNLENIIASALRPQAASGPVPKGAARTPAATRHSVVVTCYNYEDFVVDAINSALAQQPAPHEVVVVDDGSTDSSRERLAVAFGDDRRVTLLPQANEGQLSAFVRAIRHCTGDVVCFLDADDLWDDGYLAQLSLIYRARPNVDFVFSNLKLFGSAQGQLFAESADRDFGLTLLDAAFGYHWLGSPTSALSMRRGLARAIATIPEEFYRDWRTRADDVLVYGSSIVGARKYFCAQPLVQYRVHDANHWFGRPAQRAEALLYQIRLARLVQHFRDSMALTEEQLRLAKTEFKTKPAPTLRELERYQKLVDRAPLRWNKRIEHKLSMKRHFKDPGRAVRLWRDPTTGTLPARTF